jgi:hypothetical protein
MNVQKTARQRKKKRLLHNLRISSQADAVKSDSYYLIHTPPEGGSTDTDSFLLNSHILQRLPTSVIFSRSQKFAVPPSVKSDSYLRKTVRLKAE